MASWAAESSRDPLLLFAATCALALVASVACVVPAMRAARVSPMTAIRYE
jgi:ABC-type lipoprotein release transport system permease subunit